MTKVIASGIRCLGTVVNKVTKNYVIVRDAFEKFYGIHNLKNDHGMLSMHLCRLSGQGSFCCSKEQRTAVRSERQKLNRSISLHGWADVQSLQLERRRAHLRRSKGKIAAIRH